MAQVGIRHKCLLPLMTKPFEFTHQTQMLSLFFWKRINRKYRVRTRFHAGRFPFAAISIDDRLEPARRMLASIFFHWAIILNGRKINSEFQVLFRHRVFQINRLSSIRPAHPVDRVRINPS